ncbi:TlpA family protein disulfide reductase [Elizabethkingia anophelis]|uniref:TlpA family protein disulfide reductase n=1 Tax=Elizabethkingia anophelis TaxID=1117645 RepID=UPI00136FDD5D|nr:TlpA disulfide reductase family protein [Elizabethkingia anophelis]MCT3674377.1 TlpA family protein disulfide reductase [Elizabethkingia anophelis]MCT3681862.1 TlpA family protein disulfide reductase [Elizabethkingia anophelis]MCT3770519.1 TlpA family protein disulfide reductase [Elizabethkingia anophelis]MCT3780803.1 TlpA family protein disulfide reductase [Elizabethkingia anophelis]MCT4213189.1 TlpA family protein disulfide reductase [Elizabethkingia anophelis]
MKKNKTLKILAITIPILLIGLMIYLFNSFQKKKDKIDKLKQIPSFVVTDVNGKAITQNNLSNGNKILIYFSPSCHFCQAEAEELSKINSQYPSIKWLFIASEPLNEINAFAKQYNLNDKENILWARDEKAKVYQTFGMTGVPYFLAYDSSNKLVFRNAGAIKIEKIIEYFNEKK